MTARPTHSGLPADIAPYQLKQLLKRARVSLGLSKGAVEYLTFAIDNCQPSDFLHGRICAIWHSLERLAQVLGLGEYIDLYARGGPPDWWAINLGGGEVCVETARTR